MRDTCWFRNSWHPTPISSICRKSTAPPTTTRNTPTKISQLCTRPSLKEYLWEQRQTGRGSFTNSSALSTMIWGTGTLFRWDSYQVSYPVGLVETIGDKRTRKRRSRRKYRCLNTRKRLALISRSTGLIMRNSLTMLLSLRHRLIYNNFKPFPTSIVWKSVRNLTTQLMLLKNRKSLAAARRRKRNTWRKLSSSKSTCREMCLWLISSERTTALYQWIVLNWTYNTLLSKLG